MKPSQSPNVKFLLVLLTLVLGCVGSAQHEPEVTSDGLLSAIEDRPKLSEGALTRKTPFVEVIHKEALEKCREAGFDSENCPEFEWSVPFLRSADATDAEQAISYEWFRLETRAYHRTLLEVGAAHPALACSLGGLDLLWLVFSGDIFFPADEFCDGTGISILPKCFWACDFNLLETQCPEPKAGCSDCVDEGVETAWDHVQSEYYPDYQEVVVKEIIGELTAKGALLWSPTPLLTEGSLITPITNLGNDLEVLADVATELIPQGITQDPRAATYYTQTAAPPPLGDDGCRRRLLAGSKFGLFRVPGQGLEPAAPGIPGLEELKRTLADRESAGETYKRTLMMLLKWSEDEIYPKYTVGDGPFSNIFSGDDARFGTADPDMYACLGYTTFFQVYQKLFDPVITNSRPILRPTLCWIDYIPGITLVPKLPKFMIWANPRWHTEWNAVPEGYDIPRVKGKPLNAKFRP